MKRFFTREERGFNVVEFLILAALVVVLILIIVPNINVFLGVDKKLASANVEAQNVRAAAIAFEANTGKFPGDSDELWTKPSAPTDYIGEPRAYYVIDVGTGRILSATTGTVGHLPTNPWTGIKWDYNSGSWVKQ